MIISFVVNVEAQTRIMTYNIRYDNKDDGENCWEYRKSDLVKLINYYHPHILGIQEGLENQVNYIAESLSDYAIVGVGRDDGRALGEFSAIVYDSIRYDCIDSNTFWLSEISIFKSPSDISTSPFIIKSLLITAITLMFYRIILVTTFIKLTKCARRICAPYAGQTCLYFYQFQINRSD